MISSDFSQTAIERLRPWMAIASAQQAAYYASQGSPADLVRGFAQPLVATIIGGFIGLSPIGASQCAMLTSVVLGSGDEDETNSVGEASQRLGSVASELLDERLALRKDDLIGRLVGRYLQAGIYDQEQMIPLVTSLITAGLETTANMISLCVMTLLNHSDQLTLLRKNRSLLPNAVSELQRYLSIGDIVTARVATADIRLGRNNIPADAGVVALTASANRDPAVFHYPDVLDISRNAKSHLSFGYGRHKCLGQHLANVVIECAIGALLDRFGALRMSPSNSGNGKMSTGVICGVDRLSLEWSLF
jgi:cytochrome P450